MYDSIVVGARCAGASTAMLLARQGCRVLLVDRAGFPSDTLSGHAIQPAGVAALARWGLLERLRATGAPFIRDVRFDTGDVVLEGSPLAIDGISDLVCVRRTILDALLVDAAAEAGAEVRLGFTVQQVLTEDGRVVGVRGRDSAGRIVEERASVVIGADGAHSRVADAVGAARYNERQATTVAAYTYYRGVDVSAAELYPRPNRMVVVVPTNDDLVIVAQSIAVADAPAYRADIEAAFTATIASIPELAERVARGERVERFRFTTETGGFFRVPCGPGWALVGDAGYHKDPITAQGMRDAFRDAELLADAVTEGLDGDLDGALVGYHRTRDASAMAMYEFTCGLAEVHVPPPDELQHLLRAVVGNPTQTVRFLGLMAGSVAVEDFFHPDSVGAILADAAVAV